MNRKYLNYAVFLVVVVLVVGLAISHSQHTQQLVDNMAGRNKAARVSAARELVEGEQFMDAISGETVAKRVRIAQALDDWASEAPPSQKPEADSKAKVPKDAVTTMIGFLKDNDAPVRNRVLVALISVATLTDDNLIAAVAGIKDGDANARKNSVLAMQVIGQDDPAKAEAMLAAALPRYPIGDIQAALARRNPTVAGTLIDKIVALMKVEAGARATGGDVLAAMPAKRDASVAALTPLLKDSDEGVRTGAISALGKVGSPAPVPTLISMMHTDTPQVRRVAIGALAQIAASSCEPALTESINTPDDDNEARAQACVGLGKIGSTSAVATLVKTLGDYDLKVQLAAVTSLATVGRAAVPPLLATLHSPKTGLRARAAQALGEMQNAIANPGLIGALKDTAPAVRSEAATGLGVSNNGAAVPSLVTALHDPDGTVAAAAADALATIGAPAHPALVQTLSANNSAAFLAARALAREGASALPAVTKAAAIVGPSSQWAARTLGAIGGPDAVRELQRLKTCTDEATRQAAVEALSRLGIS